MGVDTVEVAGETATPAQRFIDAAGIPLGTPLMRVDVRAATARVADLPQVASVDVRRQWPRTVVLSVTEREAVAVALNEQMWELIDANAVPFAVTPRKPKGLPEVESVADDATFTAVLDVLAVLSPEIRGRVQSASASSPEAVRLTLRKGRGVVNWGSARDAGLKATVLGVLLQTDAGWYDVSNPLTPATAEVAPGPPAPQDGASPAPSAPQTTAEPTGEPSTSPSPSALQTSPPAAAESAVGVIPAG
jgi:cell division protein FtsQ